MVGPGSLLYYYYHTREALNTAVSASKRKHIGDAAVTQTR